MNVSSQGGDGRRQSLVTYRFLNLKNPLSPVLSKLCNGSVQSAVELLLQDKKVT